MNERNWVGLGLMVLGVALILGLEALVNLSTDTSDYALIERRIPGGTVLGFGLGVFHLRSWNNKVAFFANVFAWLTVGALIGRISGILAVGGDTFLHWLWAGSEVVVIAVAFGVARYREAKHQA